MPSARRTHRARSTRMNHMSDIAADFALGIPAFSVALAKRVPAD